MKSIFVSGFLQVFLVTAQTLFIARQNWLGVLLFGFAISFLWASNVRKIAISGIGSQIVYASGASFGAVTGLAFSSLMAKGL